jgi:hypothetical protein
MLDAHLVMRQVQQAIAQPSAFCTHHQYGRMLCDWTVVCRESFRTPRNSVDNIAACVFLLICGCGRRRRYGITGVYPPASPCALTKKFCRFADLEHRNCFSGTSGGLERNVTPGCDLAGGSNNGIDTKDISRTGNSTEVALVELILLARYYADVTNYLPRHRHRE